MKPRDYDLFYAVDIAARFRERRDLMGNPRLNKIAFTNGCFDLLHSGHGKLLEWIDKIPDPDGHPYALIVAVNSDAAVRNLKGPSRPLRDQEDRRYMVSRLYPVHAAFILDDISVVEAITAIRPDRWIKGADYSMDTLNKDEVAAAEEVGAKILFAPKVEGISTTAIIERMKHGC